MQEEPLGEPGYPETSISSEAPTPGRGGALGGPVRTLVGVPFAYLLLGNALALAVFLLFGDTGSIGTVVMPPVVAIAMAAWYRHRFRGSFDGLFGWSGTGMLLTLPALLFMALNLNDVVAAESLSPVLPCLGMAFAAGISEEIVFRGIVGSNLMRIRGEARDVLPNLVATSLVFGLVHGGNILVGASVSATALQVFYAFCMGTLFEAVLLRCGSLWPSIIMHALIDFVGLLSMDIADGGIITEGIALDAGTITVAIISIIVLACALYLTRPSKRAGIVDLWDGKWHRTQAE